MKIQMFYLYLKKIRLLLFVKFMFTELLLKLIRQKFVVRFVVVVGPAEDILDGLGLVQVLGGVVVEADP